MVKHHIKLNAKRFAKSEIQNLKHEDIKHIIIALLIPTQPVFEITPEQQ